MYYPLKESTNDDEFVRLENILNKDSKRIPYCSTKGKWNIGYE